MRGGRCWRSLEQALTIRSSMRTLPILSTRSESMTANKLACVTAGKEFTWGANVPASTVVVTTTFAETTSVAGMLQYVGRAARRGLTTHGQAIFEREEDLDRIFQSPDGLSTEARTMERFATWWLSKGETW